MSIIQKIMHKLFNLSYYVSELDQFLKARIRKHPQLSASQLAEQQKYARIFKLRDDSHQPAMQKNTKKIWENF